MKKAEMKKVLKEEKQTVFSLALLQLN